MLLPVGTFAFSLLFSTTNALIHTNSVTITNQTDLFLCIDRLVTANIMYVLDVNDFYY